MDITFPMLEICKKKTRQEGSLAAASNPALRQLPVLRSTYQSPTSSHGERALHQSDGLGDATHHSGDDLGLLGDSDSSRLVNGDYWARGCVGRGDRRGANLSGSGLQHPGGGVAHLGDAHRIHGPDHSYLYIPGEKNPAAIFKTKTCVRQIWRTICWGLFKTLVIRSAIFSAQYIYF